jgi:hypothetical protein
MPGIPPTLATGTPASPLAAASRDGPVELEVPPSPCPPPSWDGRYHIASRQAGWIPTTSTPRSGPTPASPRLSYAAGTRIRATQILALLARISRSGITRQRLCSGPVVGGRDGRPARTTTTAAPAATALTRPLTGTGRRLSIGSWSPRAPTARPGETHRRQNRSHPTWSPSSADTGTHRGSLGPRLKRNFSEREQRTRRSATCNAESARIEAEIRSGSPTVTTSVPRRTAA